MATISQHISNVRALIKQYGRTDESYTDQFLYQLLKGERNDLLSEILRKFNHVSEWNWQTYCMPLIKAKPYNCNCVPDTVGDCLALRSKYKIPQAVKGRNKSYVEFKTLGGDRITLYEESEWLRLKDDDIIGKKLAGSIIDGYLYIWNNLKLKVVSIGGIWQDQMEWAVVPKCNDDGTESIDICFNPLTEEFPLDLEKQNYIYTKILSLLKIPLQLPQDQTNDNNESIKS